LSHNKTSLSPEIQQKLQEKKQEIIAEVIFGGIFLAGGIVLLAHMFLKYSRKKTD